MKHLIAVEASKKQATKLVEKSPVPALSLREQNVVRYMAGYIARKLLKKHRNGDESKIEVLTRMKASHDDSACDASPSLSTTFGDLDITKDWVELVDRDGLCHVTDERDVCSLQISRKRNPPLLKPLFLWSTADSQRFLEHEEILALGDHIASQSIQIT